VSTDSTASANEQSEFPLRLGEVISVLVALGLVIANLVRFLVVPHEWSWLAVVGSGVAVVLGLVLADFGSGVVHWAGDTWGDERTPLLGPRFIRPFRSHHAHPLDMLNRNFFTLNGSTAMTSLPVLVVPFFLPLESDVWWAVAVFLWSAGLCGMWTNQFHQWAHMKNPPRVVSWLQRCRVILSPAHHRRHHKSPYAANYCITTGWCNPLLEQIRFWPALEWVVSRLTGLRPRGEAPAQRN